tara:strand:+ start:41924 stop:42415 length:492 start_codon:yes stop_codon:yes gene_type:complete
VKTQNNTIKIKSARLFLSFFGVGFAPKAPGTFGSAATLPLLYLFGLYSNIYTLAIFTVVLFIASVFIAEYAQNELHVHDPGWIVMDEVLGMLVTYMFVFPSLDFIELFLVFVIFRFFDIIKIWPASYFDKKIKHGLGTIIDDVISAIYAGIVVLLVKNYYLIN